MIGPEILINQIIKANKDMQEHYINLRLNVIRKKNMLTLSLLYHQAIRSSVKYIHKNL